MVDGQHSRPAGGVPAAGRETARRASLEVSRRTLLGAVCTASVLSRHSGLDPESTLSSPSPQGRWIPDQVRDDEESSVVTIWDRALARFHAAQAEVDAASGEPDQERYMACPERLPWQAVEGPSSTPPTSR